MDLSQRSQQEWTRRVLACPHAPRVPRTAPTDARYRDENALLWQWDGGSWVLCFGDAATRIGLLERLKYAEIEETPGPAPHYIGRWGHFETHPHEHVGEVVALLYESFVPRSVYRMERLQELP